MAGRKKLGEKLRNKDAKYKVACEDLSAHSSKTWDPGGFRDHVLCVFKHFVALFNHAFRPFSNFQGKQRAIHKIVAKLAPKNADGKRSKIVLVVGNGCRSPTSHGHDSAPGKALRQSLSRFFPVIMSDERNSSCLVSCCAGAGAGAAHRTVRGTYDANAAEHKRGRQIRGLAHCPKCGSTLDRDISAALNIRKIFLANNNNLITPPIERQLYERGDRTGVGGGTHSRILLQV